MMELTLYIFNGACSLAPHILLEETGLPYRTVQMRVSPSGGLESADGTVSREDYLKINPASLIPSLVVDGAPITEGPAILGFIASLVPERGWQGKTALERARVSQWLAWISGTLHGRAYGMVLRPERVSVNEDQHAGVREKGKGLVREAYARIEGQIGEGGYLLGEADTLADYYLVPFWHWAGRNGMVMDAYPKYTQLVRRVEAKEAAARVLKDEGVQPA